MRSINCFLVYSLIVGAAAVSGLGEQFASLSIVSMFRLEEQQESGLAVIEPMKCSPSGELYVRFARSTPEQGVSIVSADRQHVYRLGFADAAELNGSTVLDFAPGPNHSVFFLADRQKDPHGQVEHYIVRLGSDGTSLMRKLDTQPGLFLGQITTLGSDNFVVAGYLQSEHKPAKPFAAIFDDRGQFLREVLLAGDVRPKDLSRSNSGLSKGSPDPFASLLEASSLQTADDGRAYLMRRNPEGPVFLISPGAVVEMVKLKPPGKAALLSSVKVNGGAIAAEYYIPSPSPGASRVHYLTITDLGNGNLLQEIRYTGSQQTGVGMVCYDRNSGFEFLSQTLDGHLEVVFGVGR
jgi:hypothetical protein